MGVARLEERQFGWKVVAQRLKICGDNRYFKRNVFEQLRRQGIFVQSRWSVRDYPNVRAGNCLQSRRVVEIPFAELYTVQPMLRDELFKSRHGVSFSIYLHPQVLDLRGEHGARGHQKIDSVPVIDRAVVDNSKPRFLARL